MIRKTYQLKEESLKIIEKVKKNYQFSSDSEALRYIISVYENEEIQQLLSEQKQAKKIIRQTEDKIDIMYDALNTILIQSNIETCIEAEYLESAVYKRSKACKKNRVEKLKQKKDWKQKKTGVKIDT